MSFLRRQFAFLLLLGISAFCGVSGGYIWAKAAVAQVLLRHAWEQTSAEESKRPWPWADTYPVARLLAPEHSVDLVVLSGVSGRSLAFGPGHQPGSALPGDEGNSIIAAHRDTHFRFLKDLQLGERILLVTGEKKVKEFRVQSFEIVDENDNEALGDPLLLTPFQAHLTLVTCYPFDAPLPGATQRYLVRLQAMSEDV